MAKPKWGTKRSCPKCGARFYDLGKENPVTCIECDITWVPEPVLKSKQPFVAAKKQVKKASDAKPEDKVEKQKTEEVTAKADANEHEDVLVDVDTDSDDGDDDITAVVDAKLDGDENGG